jgi:hypothetical protein
MRTYVVWIPMLDRDELSEVPAATTSVGVSPQYFDGNMLIGRGLGRSAGLPNESVWDVFMFYPAGVTSIDGLLPFPDYLIAQQGGVVVGTPSSLPPTADQSRLPRELRGKVHVIGEQKNFEAILQQAATTFVAKK